MIVEDLCDEDILDLNRLARLLESMLCRAPRMSGAEGRERIRWTVRILAGCSREASERVVEALILRRQLLLCTDACGREYWRIGPPPAKC